MCVDQVSIKAGLQQQLKDKDQQYTGRVTIVDHQYQFLTNGTNDQQQLLFLCDANAYPSVVDHKKPALRTLGGPDRVNGLGD